MGFTPVSSLPSSYMPQVPAKAVYDKMNEITVNSTISAIGSQIGLEIEIDMVDDVWGVSVSLKDGRKYFFYPEIAVNSTVQKTDMASKQLARKTASAR